MEQEIWKDVIGFEGKYQVSNLGNVKSLYRKIHRQNRWPMILKERVLKNMMTTTGYYYVTPMIGNKKHTVRVHILVAKAFIQNPLNKPYVNHIDGNKLNNNINNLEWCTASENLKHSYDNGLRTAIKQASHFKIILNKETGIFYNSIREASKIEGLPYTTFLFLIRKENYKYNVV